MYQVFIKQSWNGKELLIHSAHNNMLKVANGVVTLDVAAIPSFTFTIYANNPGYDQLHYLTTFVRVFDTRNQRNIFEGRILVPSEPLESNGQIYKEYTCEGYEAFLHDSRPDFVDFTNQTRAQILTTLINKHNQQMKDGGNDFKCIKLGNIDLGSSAISYRYTDDNVDTFENISNLILADGFEMALRVVNGDLYLDAAKSIGGKGQQKIELKKNLLSFTRSIDPTSLVTAFKPLGNVIDTNDDNTDKGTARLTIASVNNGSPLIRNEKLISEFGLIVGSNTWDDITDANLLKSTGISYFNGLSVASVTTQIQAVDLSLVDQSKKQDPLLCGWSYRTVISVKGIDAVFRITQQTLNLNNVEQNTITIGDRVVGQESYDALFAADVKAMADIKAKVDYQNKKLAEMKQLSTDYRTANDKQIASLLEKIKELESTGASYFEGSIIDVSEFQGSINWNQVVSGGLALGIIRIQDGSDYQDKTYQVNVPGAIAAGANYAVYAYFHALNPSDAVTEATDFYNRTQKVITGNVQPRFYAIDVEAPTVTNGTMRDAVNSYMNALNNLGVSDAKIVLYISNNLYSSFNLDVSRAGAVWLPTYGANDGNIPTNYKPNFAYDLWQYTSVGKVSGINANVDMNTSPSSRFKENYLKKG
ncbi:phage tail spike protein [Lapidilactobacillus wuchangensis]|uniref:phage tail spike protein n=1 Tax=Lapidilactobacillus wuchangensis TaxID=2486001 RepID=UPI000F77C4FE|nr:phage tail spike protein [Lapidilactobacillus wuchangensis]